MLESEAATCQKRLSQRYISLYERLREVRFQTLYTSDLRERENSVTRFLEHGVRSVLWRRCNGVFYHNWLERQSANDREGTHLSLCFRYSWQRMVKIVLQGKSNMLAMSWSFKSRLWDRVNFGDKGCCVSWIVIITQSHVGYVPRFWSSSGKAFYYPRLGFLSFIPILHLSLRSFTFFRRCLLGLNVSCCSFSNLHHWIRSIPEKIIAKRVCIKSFYKPIYHHFFIRVLDTDMYLVEAVEVIL